MIKSQTETAKTTISMYFTQAPPRDKHGGARQMPEETEMALCHGLENAKSLGIH
jgi:hypothetical protein